jgi:hypothetical protein
MRRVENTCQNLGDRFDRWGEKVTARGKLEKLDSI